MSAAGSATQIASGALRIITLYKVAGGIRADARATRDEIKDQARDQIDALAFTPYEVVLETPEPGETRREPGTLLQRTEQAPDRGWIAPVAVGVVGVGILAFLYLRK